MNTFLPVADFEACAYLLDLQRLRRQISECKWIIDALTNRPNSSISSRGMHPVFKLWTSELTRLPYIWHLRQYQLQMARVYRQLSHKSHVDSLACGWIDTEYLRPSFNLVWPEKVHASHRANLIRKDPSYYRLMFGTLNIPIPDPAEGYAWEHPSEIEIRTSHVNRGA